jgi:hypothetical protein
MRETNIWAGEKSSQVCKKKKSTKTKQRKLGLACCIIAIILSATHILTVFWSRVFVWSVLF